MAVLNKMAATGLAGQPQSNPSELAAAGGETPKPETGRWTDEERQVSQHILSRYRAPAALVSTLLASDDGIGWALNLNKDQAGFDAKTNRFEARVRELETELAVTKDRLSRKPSKESGKDSEGATMKEVEALLKTAIEDSDTSKIGPALEKLLHLRQPAQEVEPRKEEAPAPRTDPALEDVLFVSARKELEAEWPGLRNRELADRVRRVANGLNVPELYDHLSPLEQLTEKLRHAALMTLGAPQVSGSNQTNARPPGSSAPRPDGRSSPATSAQMTPMEAAAAALERAGHRA